jgi:protein SCO1/2
VRLLLPLCCIALLAMAGSASSEAPDREHEALRVSQAAIGVQVQPRGFTDQSGRPVDLGTLFERPTVVSLIYTSCYHTCPTITERLAHAVRVGTAALGAEAFNVASVGFDVGEDTPERMRNYASERHIDASNWYFLSGDQAAVEGLTRDLGFVYTRVGGGFEHLAQISILDTGGRVYAQVYGSDFQPDAIVEPLRRIRLGTPPSAGGIGALLEKIRLFCTVYDPAAGRYNFDYSLLTAVLTGILCLGAVAVFIVVSWRREPAVTGRRGAPGDVRR